MSQIRGAQVLNGTIKREDLDASTPEAAVIRRALAGPGIALASTGPDVGTGDVTIRQSGTTAPRSGRLLTPAITAAPSGTLAALANNIYALPIRLLADLSFSGVRCEVVTGVAANLRMAVYRSLDSAGNYPGALIAGSDALQTANAAGIKTTAVSFSGATGEVLWVCYWASAAVTVRSHPGTTIQANILGSVGASGFAIGNSYVVPQTFGVFPSSFPGGQTPSYLPTYPILGLILP